MSDTQEYERLVTALSDLTLGAKCSPRIRLEALIDVVAGAIFTFATDNGADLKRLENQFFERVHGEIVEYEPDEDYYVFKPNA